MQTATRICQHAPAVRDALASGAISLGHASVVAGVLNELGVRAQRVDTPLTWEVRASAQATMLHLAASLGPGQLAVAGQVLIQRVDPDPDYTGDDGISADAARRWFTMSRDSPMAEVRSAARSTRSPSLSSGAAVSALSAPRPRTAEGENPRTAAQRRGDALVDLAQRALASGELPEEGGGTGTTVLVRCDHDHLQAQLADTNPTLETGIEIPVEKAAPDGVRRAHPGRGPRLHGSAVGHRTRVADRPAGDAAGVDPARRALRVPRMRGPAARGVRPTTSSSGHTADLPPCRTLRRSAGTTTA